MQQTCGKVYRGAASADYYFYRDVPTSNKVEGGQSPTPKPVGSLTSFGRLPSQPSVASLK